MYKARTSYKQASEAAALLGGVFYGKDEYRLNNKCYVRLNGDVHEFDTYTAALEWMLEECARNDFGGEA